MRVYLGGGFSRIVLRDAHFLRNQVARFKAQTYFGLTEAAPTDAGKQLAGNWDRNSYELLTRSK